MQQYEGGKKSKDHREAAVTSHQSGWSYKVVSEQLGVHHYSQGENNR